jgi:hypothetical protein
MPSPWLIALIIAVVAVAGFAVPLARRWQRRQVRHAVVSFRRQREMLEARFLDLARARGKPRGLRWLDCDWLDSINFARDRKTGLITAFVGINVRFEAVEGGEMEEVAAVGTVRDAVALFHYQAGVWGTGGRALFNMNPADAVARLAAQYDPLPIEATMS